MKRLSKPRLFLLELVLDLLFFCVCAAVCVALLTRAAGVSRANETLTHAVEQAQNAAEAFKAADGDPARTARLLGTDGALPLLFDENWNSTAEDAVYLLQIEISRDKADLCTAEIRVERMGDHKPVYALTVRRLAGEVGA